MAKVKMSEEIQELNSQLKTAERAVDKIRAELKNAHYVRIGIQPGDIVMYKGAKAKVIGFDTTWDWDSEKPWLNAYIFKKGGSLGILPRNLFSDWEKIDG